MRYVTNEQRRRRTLFKPTPWAVASWLICCVAHSLRPAPVLRWRQGCRSVGMQKLVRDARRLRLENQPTDRRRYASYLSLDALVQPSTVGELLPIAQYGIIPTARRRANAVARVE